MLTGSLTIPVCVLSVNLQENELPPLDSLEKQGMNLRLVAIQLFGQNEAQQHFSSIDRETMVIFNGIEEEGCCEITNESDIPKAAVALSTATTVRSRIRQDPQVESRCETKVRFGNVQTILYHHVEEHSSEKCSLWYSSEDLNAFKAAQKSDRARFARHQDGAMIAQVYQSCSVDGPLEDSIFDKVVQFCQNSEFTGLEKYASAASYQQRNLQAGMLQQAVEDILLAQEIDASVKSNMICSDCQDLSKQTVAFAACLALAASAV